MTPNPPATPSITFESSIIRLNLTADLRGYVLFDLQVADDSGKWTGANTPDNLACEYLVDLLNLTIAAMRWIDANCEDITHEGTHLYYRFRGPDEQPPVKIAPVRRRGILGLFGRR